MTRPPRKPRRRCVQILPLLHSPLRTVNRWTSPVGLAGCKDGWT